MFDLFLIIAGLIVAFFFLLMIKRAFGVVGIVITLIIAGAVGAFAASDAGTDVGIIMFFVAIYGVGLLTSPIWKRFLAQRFERGEPISSILRPFDAEEYQNVADEITEDMEIARRLDQIERMRGKK